MPELPEVQTTVNGINQYAKKLVIVDAWTNYKSTYHTGKDNIKDPKYFSYFKKQIIGKKILNAERRAKNVLVNLDDGATILIHMKMTGHVMYGKYRYNPKENLWEPEDKNSPLGDPFNRHVRLVLTLSNGYYLALADTRKFAKVTHITKENKSTNEHLKDIGPEPLEQSFGVKEFTDRLKKRPKVKVKTVLLDPKIIAGIGNIYSDEILWYAGVHPERKVEDISHKEFRLMHKAMKDTLNKGINFGGDSMSDYRNILGERGTFQNKHNAYRKTGQRCGKKNCKGIILRKVVGARSAHFCSIHQK